MNNLARFERDGIEVLINIETGETFASISGYARMSGKSKSTISERCTVRKEKTLEAVIETESGSKTVRLITESTISDWIVDDNPLMAKQLLKAGVRVFLHKLAGYQVTSTAIEEPKPRSLPPIRDAIEYIDAADRLESLKGKMPAAIIQLLLDKLGDELCGQKPLPSDQHRLVGCAQKAEELGFKVTEKNRGSLGKFVKSQGLKSIPQEERLVNGQLRKVNMYEDCVELEEAISAFFR